MDVAARREAGIVDLLADHAEAIDEGESGGEDGGRIIEEWEHPPERVDIGFGFRDGFPQAVHGDGACRQAMNSTRFCAVR